MRDVIFKRQNEEDLLDLLYAQRISYDKAEVYNKIGWGMTLLLTILAVGELFIPLREQSSSMIEIIVAVVVICGRL